jgi:hypothetical protein
MSSSVEGTGYHDGRFTTLNSVSIITAPAMGQGLLGGEKCDLVQYLLRLNVWNQRIVSSVLAGTREKQAGNPGKHQKEVEA